MLSRSVLFGAVLFMGATSGRSAAQSSAAFETMELERTACLGTCPVYSVKVRADGNVEFSGVEFVAHEGIRTSQISVSSVSQLASALSVAQLDSLQAYYVPGQPGCESHRTDHPSIKVRAVVDGKTQSGELYTGCDPVPGAERIVALAQLIDELAGTSQWIKGAEPGR